MNILSKKINDLTASDIQILLENGAVESKYLEFKSDINIGNDAEKREFLRDISAFANTQGGIIIYGISEDKHRLPLITGISSEYDSLLLQIQAVIQMGISPRIQGIEIGKIDIECGKYLLLIRIPRSYLQPHMVDFKGSIYFYGRNNAGKYPMDVFEICNTFISSYSNLEVIKNFIDQRQIFIRSHKYSPGSTNHPYLTIHIIPIGAFGISKQMLDLQNFWNHNITPMHGAGYNQRHNLEGVFRYSKRYQHDSIDSSIQFFRTGIIEIVCSSLFMHNNGCFYLYVDDKESIEYLILKYIKAFIEYLASQNISFPLYCFISLHNIEKCTFTSSIGLQVFGPNGSERSQVNLPEIIVPSPDAALKSEMKYCMDVLWNSFGYASSLRFDDNPHINALFSR